MIIMTAMAVGLVGLCLTVWVWLPPLCAAETAREKSRTLCGRLMIAAATAAACTELVTLNLLPDRSRGALCLGIPAVHFIALSGFLGGLAFALLALIVLPPGHVAGAKRVRIASGMLLAISGIGGILFLVVRDWQ